MWCIMKSSEKSCREQRRNFLGDLEPGKTRKFLIKNEKIGLLRAEEMYGDKIVHYN